MPRLLIAWMCTEACRTRSPELYLGRNQNEFLNKLQLPSDGRYIKNLNEQILALVWSQISIKGSRVKNLNFESIQIANNGFVFWSPSHSGKIRKWTNTLTLSPDFYKAITMAPVPLHIETLHSLRKSPLAMDIYTWLVYRMFTLKVAAKWGRSNDVKIHWADLKCQFGGDYENTPQGVRSFRVNFLKQLKGVLLFYPEARNFIEEDANYLILKPGARLVVQQRLPE